MVDTCGELGIENNVSEWKSYICRAVRSPAVLIRMPNFFSTADVTYINNIHQQQSSAKATFLFIEKLIKCKQPGKWTAFRQALAHSDYGYLASLLTSKCKSPENSRHQRKMLQIFSPYLDMLEPIELIVHLVDSGLINSEDREEIIACQNCQGSVAATMLMLDRLQRRRAPSVWYMEFLRVLHQKGYTELVKEMEPDFSIDCEVLKVPFITITDSSDSEVENGFSMNSNLEDAIETKVEYFNSQILELISVEKLLPHICSLISIDCICHVMRKNSTKNEAMECVLTEIKNLKSKTKWRCFIDCLKKADYPYVAELLTRPRSERFLHKERCILNLFEPALNAQLEPLMLLQYLMDEQVINQRDKEEILTTFDRSGSMAASSVLLECMKCRLAPGRWYKAFLHCLLKCDRHDLVEMIDPDFVKRLNNDSEFFNEVDVDSGDAELDEKLEEAYCHLHKMKKENDKAISSIRDNFQRHEQQLVNEVNQKYNSCIKILEDISEKIKCLQYGVDGNIACPVIEKEDIREILSGITSKRFHVIPESRFMDIKQLATVRDSDDRFPGDCDASLMPTGAVNRRMLLARRRHLSVGSSSSSQSSGYVIVSKSRSSRSSINLSSSSDRSVTFADGVISPTITDSEQGSRKTEVIPKMAKRLSYFEEVNNKPRFATNRRRCLSESSIMSTDGSMSSSVDRPSSSNTDGKTDSPSLSSTLTKVSTVSEKKPFERTDSFLYHQGFVLPERKKCMLSNMCVLPTKHVVLVDDLKSGLYIFDEMTKTFKVFQFKNKRRVATNRRRCLSESSIMSTDGSMSSSVDRPSSSSTDGKTDSPSLSSTLTKVSTVSEKKPIERTDSFLYHQGFVLPERKKCMLSNMCVLPTKHVVLVNDLKSCLYIFDEMTKPFKVFQFKRFSPLKVCALQEAKLLILFQKRDGSTKLVQYEIQFSRPNRVDDITVKSEVLVDSKCRECVRAISSTKDRLIALCLNKHLHLFSQDCCELNVISLDIQVSEWWPHLCAMDPSGQYVFVHDVYSLNIYCFTNVLHVTRNGKCSPKWIELSYEIEGMVVCGDHLYVSENSGCVISRLYTSNGKSDKPLRENVHRPFALSCIPGEETILVSQYHPNATKINRTVKYF